MHTDNLYSDMKQNLNKFDASNFPPLNICNIPQQNKAVLGLFKDEKGSYIIFEFIGLRTKIYALNVEKLKVLKNV